MAHNQHIFWIAVLKFTAIAMNTLILATLKAYGPGTQPQYLQQSITLVMTILNPAKPTGTVTQLALESPSVVDSLKSANRWTAILKLIHETT